jgi:hypothetical protein
MGTEGPFEPLFRIIMDSERSADGRLERELNHISAKIGTPIIAACVEKSVGLL